jgi:hypothetical protein
MRVVARQVGRSLTDMNVQDQDQHKSWNGDGATKEVAMVWGMTMIGMALCGMMVSYTDPIAAEGQVVMGGVMLLSMFGLTIGTQVKEVAVMTCSIKR